MAAVERVYGGNREAIAYLEGDFLRNALDIWGLGFEGQRSELYVVRDEGEMVAHLSIYHAPEADYVNIGGTESEIGPLLTLIPGRAVVFLTLKAFEAAKGRLKPDSVVPNDMMIVRRGEERLFRPDLAVRLSEKDATGYAGFGSSFNSPPAPIEWAREGLADHPVFGVFDDGRLVSVASVTASLPDVGVIMGVETQRDFRRKGYGSAVVSAATREALRRSKSCVLWVASRNTEALGLYRRLGFRKIGEEMWLDFGTGLTPG
jgi:ribosomal protein S18 acetylase RimI-like enzyme